MPNRSYPKLTNDQYLKGLLARDTATLSNIYENFFAGVANYVIEQGGTEEDAEDIFQEGLVIVYRKAKALELSSSFHTYLFAVCKRIWWKHRSKTKLLPLTEERIDGNEMMIIQEVEENEQYKLYQDKFKLLSEECQSILRLFFSGFSMKEITEKLSFSSVGYLKKRKFICKKKLITLVKNDGRYKELTAYDHG